MTIPTVSVRYRQRCSSSSERRSLATSFSSLGESFMPVNYLIASETPHFSDFDLSGIDTDYLIKQFPLSKITNSPGSN
jgi:hypothetical protein